MSDISLKEAIITNFFLILKGESTYIDGDIERLEQLSTLARCFTQQ